MPMETGNYKIDPNVLLKFSAVTDEAVEYKCTLAVQFQLNIFGKPYYIFSRDIIIDGIHNFKDESPAVDQEHGNGNQNDDAQLE